MKFELTILGCSSATPTSNRFPSAQVLNISEHFFLIDCGEGAQIQLRRFSFKIQRINHIFISHLHGDHYFGLMGLLSSMHLLGRKKPVHLYAHANLREIINIQLKSSDTRLNYELIFHPLAYEKSEIILDEKTFTVETILLNHRIPCCGFLFREKPRERSIVKSKIKEFEIPVSFIPAIKNGEDFLTLDGRRIPNNEITLEPPPPRSFAYCSDTCYDERLLAQISEVDLLYHEATFLHEMLERAKETYHTTALQAGTLALKANVKQLIIGHYSARYKNPLPLLKEAQSVFPATLLGEEGKTYVF